MQPVSPWQSRSRCSSGSPYTARLQQMRMGMRRLIPLFVGGSDLLSGNPRSGRRRLSGCHAQAATGVHVISYEAGRETRHRPVRARASGRQRFESRARQCPSGWETRMATGGPADFSDVTADRLQNRDGRGKADSSAPAYPLAPAMAMRNFSYCVRPPRYSSADSSQPYSGSLRGLWERVITS